MQQLIISVSMASEEIKMTYEAVNQLMEGRWIVTKRYVSFVKSLQLDHKDLLFEDFIITDINSGLKDCIFAEILPHTFTSYIVWRMVVCCAAQELGTTLW